jgi:molecular chaperone GrpE (heat shock protein)
VNRAFEDLSKQSAKARTEQQNQIQDLKVKTAQQYLAMQANLQNLQSVQANYLNAFGGFVQDPFAQAFLNITT